MPFPMFRPKSLLVKPRGFFPFSSFPTLKLFQAFSDGWGFCSWLIQWKQRSPPSGQVWGQIEEEAFSAALSDPAIFRRVWLDSNWGVCFSLKSSMAFGTDYLCGIPKHPHRGGSPTRCHWGNVTGTNCFHGSEFFPHGHSTNLEQVAPSPERRLFSDGELPGPQVVNTTLKTCSLLISFLLIIFILLEMQLIAP